MASKPTFVISSSSPELRTLLLPHPDGFRSGCAESSPLHPFATRPENDSFPWGSRQRKDVGVSNGET